MCNDLRNESFTADCKTFKVYCTSKLLQFVTLVFMMRDAKKIVV